MPASMCRQAQSIKPHHGFPSQPFADIAALQTWVLGFVHWYNLEHRHSALHYVTPQQRHTGEDKAILEQRTRVYLQAKARHPERWSKDIRDWPHQGEVWLNPYQGQRPDDIQMKKTGWFLSYMRQIA